MTMKFAKLHTLLMMFLLMAVSVAAQDRLSAIERQLKTAPVQEKVYLHLDNNCYYKGDNIWYKAYVVRADNNRFTDMSRLLYVELLSPDGLLVERQTVMVGLEGHGEGCFTLTDSLYSGYYEVRAYTRWMLNFCVSQHPANRISRELFYIPQMADDFYRQFGTVHSRVVAVYERPEEKGAYDQKVMLSRPKTRLDKELKSRLSVTFYPEGGHLIAGTRATVAFEAVDEEGQQVEVQGMVNGVSIRTEHQGRGSFSIDVPESGKLKAVFHYQDKDYTFTLPDVEKSGCALSMAAADGEHTAQVQLRGVPLSAQYAAAALSRGVLKVFRRFTPDAQGRATISVDDNELPTGVSNLIVIDPDGRPMADRLFFVNHHDYEQGLISVSTDSTEYGPYQPITVRLQTSPGADHISVSVRDDASDDPSYDTGNLMTELLLSSELKGFVPHPDYYFQADDAERRRHLDLLLMVQGWRRYDYADLVGEQPLRYTPEKSFTVEGCVYPFFGVEEHSDEEIKYWKLGIFGYSESKAAHLNENDKLIYDELRRRIDTDRVAEGLTTLGEDDPQANTSQEKISSTLQMQFNDNAIVITSPESNEAGQGRYVRENGPLENEVIVECELVKVDEHMQKQEGTQVLTFRSETHDGGHFSFNLPTYSGYSILFLRAYEADITERHKQRIDLKDRFNEEADPDFYVKRNLFFPIFAKKYSYYQSHLPEDDIDELDDLGLLPGEEALSSMDQTLQEVTVKKRRRRGRRSIDYTKPACVYDAQELYNLVTDYGLSSGKFDMSNFPLEVSTLLLGTYNERRFFNVRARFNDGIGTPYIFYQNYPSYTDLNPAFVSDRVIARNTTLARQDEIKLYTDFELRNEDKHVVMESYTPDVTLEFKLMPNETKRYVYRDRRILLPGITEPDHYYMPDYSRPLPQGWFDYRRTLFWKPEVTPDDNGLVTLKLYNNGKPTRIRVSAAGIGIDGQLLFTDEK